MSDCDSCKECLWQESSEFQKRRQELLRYGGYLFCLDFVILTASLWFSSDSLGEFCANMAFILIFSLPCPLVWLFCLRGYSRKIRRVKWQVEALCNGYDEAAYRSRRESLQSISRKKWSILCLAVLLGILIFRYGVQELAEAFLFSIPFLSFWAVLVGGLGISLWQDMADLAEVKAVLELAQRE